MLALRGCRLWAVGCRCCAMGCRFYIGSGRPVEQLAFHNLAKDSTLESIAVGEISRRHESQFSSCAPTR